VDDDTDEFTYRPAGGRRRVSMFVAVPVVAGCAALGTIAGVIVPLWAPVESGGGKAVQALPAAAAPAKTVSSSEEVTAVKPAAVPALRDIAPSVTPAAEPLRAQRQPVAPQPVRTISEDEQAATPRSPVIETGSVEQRPPRPGDEATAPVPSKHETTSKHEMVPKHEATPKHETERGEPSARTEGHARRQRARKVRRVYVPRPAQQPAPAQTSGSPAVKPASQSNFTSMVPPQ
jgi:hypothetical protein